MQGEGAESAPPPHQRGAFGQIPSGALVKRGIVLATRRHSDNLTCALLPGATLVDGAILAIWRTSGVSAAPLWQLGAPWMLDTIPATWRRPGCSALSWLPGCLLATKTLYWLIEDILSRNESSEWHVVMRPLSTLLTT